MVSVAPDHLPQLRQPVLQDIRSGFSAHPGKGVIAPGWNFALDENAVLIAVVEDPPVLGPMHAREQAVQALHLIVIMGDPLTAFRHSEPRVAPRHALDSHEPYALTIQIQRRASRLEPADSEPGRDLVGPRAIRHAEYEPVQVRVIKVPPLRVVQRG